MYSETKPILFNCQTDYPNWYKVEWNGSVGWISSKKKYTKLVNLFH
jgi:hypothetical protein